MSNSYDATKSSRRSTATIKKAQLAAAASRQEKATRPTDRTEPQPTSADNRQLGRQLRVLPIQDKVGNPLNDYSSANLGACNTDPLKDGAYVPSGAKRKSPKRIVGTARP